MTGERRARIKKLFFEAAEISADKREAFLLDKCGSDDDLRGEVASLLAEDEAGTDTAFEFPAFSASRSRSDLTRSQSETDYSDPESIGAFRVKRRIGEGGMGVVYEAEQDQPRRLVAVKVLRAGIVSRSMIRRFRREGEVLGRLQHPGIAHIYEIGFTATGADGHGPSRLPYIAMELIRGRPLDDYASTKKLSTRERLSIVAEICDAVHHAHTKGVIHRDLKPRNILVDESGQPKILDFGVARVTEAGMQTITLLTNVGQLVGTVPYMSPEQVLGDSRQLDTRSDVYSLGVLLFELLAGKLPYDVGHCAIPEAVRIICEEDPWRLSTFDTTFRGDIETIVAKALEKDKERRYQSAAELAADIRRFLRDEPIVACPASTFYQLSKFAKRNRALVSGVAIALLSLTVGLTLAVSWAVKANRA